MDPRHGVIKGLHYTHLLAASCTCGAACSTNKEENCNNNIRTASEFPNGFSGSITLLMNTLTTLSGLSWSGAGGPPISFSPSPFSNEYWKHGNRTYCMICIKGIQRNYGVSHRTANMFVITHRKVVNLSTVNAGMGTCPSVGGKNSQHFSIRKIYL